MDDHQFLTEILHDAQNMALRLVYADWLEERADDRAEFLRLDVLRRKSDASSAEWQANAARWHALRQHCADGWLAALDGPQWSLVGNVVAEEQVRGDTRTLRGTKHFAAGAKVYCFNTLWGDGFERVKVIGRPRYSNAFIAIVVRSACITGWRAKLVYEPAVLRLMAHRGGAWTQFDAEQAATWLASRPRRRR